MRIFLAGQNGIHRMLSAILGGQIEEYVNDYIPCGGGVRKSKTCMEEDDTKYP